MKDRPALDLSIIMKVSKTCWSFPIECKNPTQSRRKPAKKGDKV